MLMHCVTLSDVNDKNSKWIQPAMLRIHFLVIPQWRKFATSFASSSCWNHIISPVLGSILQLSSNRNAWICMGSQHTSQMRNWVLDDALAPSSLMIPVTTHQQAPMLCPNLSQQTRIRIFNIALTVLSQLCCKKATRQQRVLIDSMLFSPHEFGRHRTCCFANRQQMISIFKATEFWACWCANAAEAKSARGKEKLVMTPLATCLTSHLGKKWWLKRHSNINWNRTIPW